MDILYDIQNKKPHILVIGDIMLDKYINCKINKYSKEADIPILDVENIENKMGGAANVCNNIINLGFECSIISIIGDDLEGEELLSLIKKTHIKNYIKIIKNRKTTTKTRLYNANRQMARYDSEVKNLINISIENELQKYVINELAKCNGVIISDYEKGCLSDNLYKYILENANKLDIPVCIDAKNNNNNKLYGCTLFKPNRPEFEKMTNYTINDINCPIFKNNIINLSKKISCKYLLVTIDKLGFILYDVYNHFFYKIPNSSNDESHLIDTCGAGDTIISVMTLLLLLINNNMDNICDCVLPKEYKVLTKYLTFLEKCADSIIHKKGTSTIELLDIVNISKGIHFTLSQNYLPLLYDINKIMKKTILFTNGCFDILHSGHIDFLTECRKRCDIFILGLNSDDSIKKNKGNKRPIIPLHQRIYNLKSLKIIDFVVVFEEKTPSSILESLRPTILAKGDKDYTLDEIVGKEYAERTELISTTEYYDTTKIINTILENYEKNIHL